MNSTQTWNAEDYASNARFVADLAAPVVALLRPQAGERILDIGCGDGALTEQLVAAGARVVGVDTSSELLVAARARGLDVKWADAQALPFSTEFDAVFSNATFHWLPDQAAALRGVKAALLPGGRFVGEFGGHGCVAAVCTALQASARRRGIELSFPWTFPSVDQFRDLLEAAGFAARSVELVPRPTLLPSGMAAWLRTFAGPCLSQFPAEEAEAVCAEVLDATRWSLCDYKGRWTADYIRLRFVAELKV